MFRWRRFALTLLVFLVTSTVYFTRWTLPPIGQYHGRTPESLFVPTAASDPPPYNQTANPLNLSSPLRFGPWTLTAPPSAGASQEFTITLTCTTGDPIDCPESYYVQLYGPAALTIPHVSFTTVSPTIVTATLRLHDPGLYNIYAWPNAISCARDQDASLPSDQHLYRLLAAGSPTTITVTTPASAARTDSWRPCHNHTEISDGRWVRTALLTPAALAFLSTPSHTHYIYAPYSCKIPHRTLSDNVLPHLRKTPHLLFIGESVTRGIFCRFVLPGGCTLAPGTPAHGNRSLEAPEAEYSFVFTNESGVAGVREALGELRQPDVVVWNTGLWLGGLAEKELRKEFRAFFEAADEMWPGNATRVVVRSTTSVVQPVTCFEAGGHGRERSARMGGWMKEEVEAWGKRGRRVGWVDAFALTDSRPETTLDGFHWVSEEGRAVKKGWVGWDREARPLVGEAEVGGMDWVWDEVLRLE